MPDNAKCDGGIEVGQVNVSINDRSYSVACGDGEEDHLRELARYLDNHVSELAKTVGQVGDARLLLLAGLMISDEYSDVLEKVEVLTAEVAALKKANDAQSVLDEQVEDKVAALLGQATVRIGKIAERLEAS
ncbi:MAG: cell division protein ZapA [Rhodobiaceae bacterium]|nr:MAG: cell division protein ZapA [Rhodobiaceae bacterium]